MKLTTKARYGLRAMCHVAHRGYASAQTIATHQAIPSRYLEEIIGCLLYTYDAADDTSEV